MTPTRRQQRLFWLLGRRLPAEHRPWVAEQLARPDFHRRRLRSNGVLVLALLVVPQLLLHLGSDADRSLLLVAVGPVAFLAIAVAQARRAPSDNQLRQLRAYHGVTADGRATDPVSMWTLSPFRRDGAILLVAIVVVLSIGVAVVVDHATTCDDAPAPAVAAIQEAVGRPAIGVRSGGGPRFAGARLSHPRRVDTGLDGVYYVAAFVRGDFTPPGGNGVGPAVWRVIEPGGVFPVDRISVSATELIAREVTPSLGYGYNSPPDRKVGRAQDCVLDST